jgi:hypothetical protein
MQFSSESYLEKCTLGSSPHVAWNRYAGAIETIANKQSKKKTRMPPAALPPNPPQVTLAVFEN